MGQEIKCVIEYQGAKDEGKALLETSEIIFRGTIRLKIPFSGITQMDSKDGKLRVDFESGPIVFHLGPAAGKWAAKIRNPPTLYDELGVKAGLRVMLVGQFEQAFEAELVARGAISAKTDLNILFVAVESKVELTRLASLAGRLKPTGSIWVVYPKGVKTVTEREVMNAGKDAGLVDTKIASFSKTLTALKMMIPIAKRKPQ